MSDLRTYMFGMPNALDIKVGMAAALPTLFQCMVKILAGTLSDRKLCNLSETPKVKLFNSIAFVGMGTFLVLLALSSDQHHLLSLGCLVLSVTMLGANTGGFFKSATLVGCVIS